MSFLLQERIILPLKRKAEHVRGVPRGSGDRHVVTEFLTPNSRKHRTHEYIWKCEKKNKPSTNIKVSSQTYLFWCSSCNFSWYRSTSLMKFRSECSKSELKALRFVYMTRTQKGPPSPESMSVELSLRPNCLGRRSLTTVTPREAYFCSALGLGDNPEAALTILADSRLTHTLNSYMPLSLFTFPTYTAGI